MITRSKLSAVRANSFVVVEQYKTFSQFWCHCLRIGGAALIRGRRLLTFLSQMRRLFEGGAYSSKYGTRQKKIIFGRVLSRTNFLDTLLKYSLCSHKLNCCSCLGPVHITLEDWKRSFISMVSPTFHTNPSRHETLLILHFHLLHFWTFA